MKKGILLILCVALLGICSSCNNNTDQDEKVVETIDYQVAYEEYSEAFVELNDMDKVSIDENKTQAVFYYLDSQSYLVPVMRQIPKQESVAKSAISALVDNTENRIELRVLGLEPVLPEGLEFQLALKEDNLMRISFNDVILSFPNEEAEKKALQAVVYTLTEFDTVDKVQVLVNNKIIESLTNGTAVGEPLTRANINALNNVIKGEYVKSTFYLFNNTSNNYTYYIPITKNIVKDHKTIPNIVEEQINLNKEMNKKIPKGFELESVVIEGQTVYITIKNEVDVADKDFIQFMRAMCLTIGQNSDADEVKLLVGGEQGKDTEILSFSIPVFANVYK